MSVRLTNVSADFTSVRLLIQGTGNNLNHRYTRN